MAIQDLVPVVKAIQYDGTNSSEIIPYFGTDPTVSEIDGVWEVDDGAHDPVTVHAGDWFVLGNYYFEAASLVSQNYFLPGNLTHP